MGGANPLFSSPAPLVWGLGGPLSPPSTDVPYLPPMLPGPMRPVGGRGKGDLGGQGISLGVQQAPWARVGQVITLYSSPTLPRESLPCLSGSLWPQGRQSFLASTPPPPSVPYVLLVHFGFPSISLGVTAPPQRPAGALVVGRC